MLKRKAIGAGLLACSLSAAVLAAEPAPLDLLVTYETRSTDSAGVTRTERWQERVLRRPGHVWTERVLPAAHAGTRDTAHGHGEPDHFDFAAAARHLSREADGTMRVDYVEHASRRVVFVPRAEYASTGFNGSWDGAAALVPPSVVMRMPLKARAAAPAGSAWREEQRSGWSTRILWDDRLGYARVIETRQLDGLSALRTVAELQPAPSPAWLPWTLLGGYEQKEYDDFMD